MNENPLMIPIFTILQSCSGPISEYDLLLQLRDQGYVYHDEEKDKNLALFRDHFLIMNALLQLQDELSQKNVRLAISALSIYLSTDNESKPASDLQVTDDDFRDYYLDWKNYTQTSGNDVKTMLTQFWDRYYAIDKRAEALKTLGLNENADRNTIVARFRRLAFQFHPDRGGANEEFHSIRHAYEILQRR